MVVNTVMEIGRRHPAAVVSARPRPSVVNITSANVRHHEAMIEARRRANAAAEDLKSAMNALSVANAENDRLRKRVSELEAENARLLGMKTSDAAKETQDQPTGKRGRRRKNVEADALPPWKVVESTEETQS